MSKLCLTNRHNYVLLPNPNVAPVAILVSLYSDIYHKSKQSKDQMQVDIVMIQYVEHASTLLRITLSPSQY